MFVAMVREYSMPGSGHWCAVWQQWISGENCRHEWMAVPFLDVAEAERFIKENPGCRGVVSHPVVIQVIPGDRDALLIDAMGVDGMTVGQLFRGSTWSAKIVELAAKSVGVLASELEGVPDIMDLTTP